MNPGSGNFFPEFADHMPMFVGREGEMAQLELRLVHEDRRVVGITGMGAKISYRLRGILIGVVILRENTHGP